MLGLATGFGGSPLRPFKTLVARIAWIALLASVGAASAALPPPLQQVLEHQGLPAEAVSFYVHEPGAGEPPLEHAADVPRQPASTIKLLTAFAALDRLGPVYAWPTEIYLRGPLGNGRLEGDLVIKGYGDPWLVEERVWLLLRALRERGLREIRGGLVIDDSHFQSPPEDPAAFDDQPERVYNVIPRATLLNFQAVRFLFLPNAEARRVDIVARPALPGLRIENLLYLADGPCEPGHRQPAMTQTSDGRGPIVGFDGDYAAACGETELNRVVLRGNAYVGALFRGLWHELGGSINGEARSGRVEAGDRLFYRQQSPPLAEVLLGVNKHSNNAMARMLLLTLGAEDGGAPGTVEKGRAAVLKVLAAHGVPSAGLVIDNGSGLSRSARVSARQLGRALEAAYTHPYGAEFVASLALAGQDGTARRLNRDGGLVAHLKTGSLDEVRAIAGYVQAKSGKRYAVVVLHNQKDLNPDAARALQAALLRWVHAH